MKKIIELQHRIEQRLYKFKNITFDQFLYSLIAFAGIQALTQYLTIETPNKWMESQYVLEFYNDPVFYLGLMLTFMIAL